MNRLFTSAALTVALMASTAHAQTSGTQAPAASGPSGAAGATQQQTGEYLADDIIGTRVRNQQNENIGSVTDLVIDRNGQVKAAVLSVGGFLGIGDKHVAVPWNQVQVRADTGGADRGASGSATGSGSAAAARDPVLMVDMTKEQLQQAPPFQTAGEQARRSRGTAPPAGTTSPTR